MTTQHAMPGSSDWRDWPVDTRAVVRRRLTDIEAQQTGKRWSDVIGFVVASEAAGITLRRDPARPSAPDAGSEVWIPAAEIEAAKPLPPRPERRSARRSAP